MKCAIVGCGSIAKVHAEAISNIPQNSIVAVADCKLDVAQGFVQNCNLDQCNVYKSLEEMIQKEDIDVLHICTPHHLHVPMAIYALEHDINVFAEKPPAISAEQFDALQSVKTKAKMGVCFQNRYNKSVKAIKDLLASGEAGKILGARAFVTWNRGEDYYTSSDWRGSLDTEGGGVLINQAIHTLDLLGHFMGKPTAVEATTINHHLKGLIEVEDTVEAYIQFNDIAASFYATTAFCMDSPIVIELVCDNRIIRMEDTEITYIFPDKTKKVLQFKEKEGPGKDYWGSGHFACIRDYYDCLENKIPFKIDINEVGHVQRLMLGIYESAKNNAVVYL